MDLPDPFESLKTAGGAILQSVACPKCSLRRRTSFGWVLEVCGLCQRSYSGGVGNGDILDRFNAALATFDWDRCPSWALRYLADGPKPVSWATLQLSGGEPVSAAPALSVALLHLGTPMKSYVKKTGAVGILWPKVFDLCATNHLMRDALATVVRLSPGADRKGHAYTHEDCQAVYDFLLETEEGMTVFGGAAQENTRLVVRSPK